MEWKTIITSVLTSGIVTVMIHSFIKGGISHHYNKKLKRFETDLNVMAEEKKLDFQRKLHDFGLYSSKRHEIYPMLYKYLIEASDAASYALTEKKYAPDRKFFEKVLLLLKNQKDCEDKEENSEELFAVREIELVKEAALSAEKAFDFFRESELFLSENVAMQCGKIVIDLMEVSRDMHSKILIEHGMDFGLKKPRDDSTLKNKIREINTQISRLKTLMKNELGIGDYQIK
jgi:hypothetical protein